MMVAMTHRQRVKPTVSSDSVALLSFGTEAFTVRYTSGRYEKRVPKKDFQLRGRTFRELEGIDLSDITSDEVSSFAEQSFRDTDLV